MRADQFRRLRDAVGLTQAEAAERLGVTRLSVARYETGARGIPEPVARLWLRICEDESKGKQRGGR